MGRASNNVEISTKNARKPLAIQREPYWYAIGTGQHLGYRKTEKARGTWIVRYYDKERGRRFESLGLADDSPATVGSDELTFQQAIEAARQAIAKIKRSDTAEVKRTGKYTVAHAAKDWLNAWAGSEGGKITATTNVEFHILPTLGGIELEKLSRSRIERWLHEQAKKPPIKVQRRMDSQKKLPPSRQSKIVYDPSDPETQRKRKDSANRVFRDLRALLNRAYDNQHVSSKAPWDTVSEFENVDVAKNEYLTLEEAQQFFAVCAQDFCDLVQGALITGCRYGELSKMRVSAYDRQLRAISLIQSKTGKVKHIFLTEDEAAFFDQRTDGKRGSDLMFLRIEGDKQVPWTKSNQQPRMEAALKAAGIERHVRFHDLRHTFATLLAMNGTSMQLIANQLGHSGTRMAEKHYAHFSPSYVASTIRANKPSIVTASKPGPVLVAKVG